jgi:cupin 2 domain-containing protein
MINIEVQSLFADVPSNLPEEQFSALLQTEYFRLDRIVSAGHTTPEGEWCDQEENEWLVVLQGSAEIRFEDGGVTKTLCPGEYLQIPAHVRHRVEFTDPDQPTVWLALHYS